MKRIAIFVFVGFIVVLSIATIVVQKRDVVKMAKINTDDDYKQYEILKSEGAVDESNNYIIKYSDPDKIRVSFGENKLMDIEYYYDEAMSNRIEETAYLLPGDTIYIKHIENKSSDKELYEFSRYEVYEINNQSNKERIVKLNDSETHYTIPENFKGKEIQIIPYGKYKKGTISLNAYCNSNGNIKEAVITGSWQRDNTLLAGNILEIGPSEAYTLSYSYNADEYFLYSTLPEFFSKENGKVTFITANSSDVDNPTEYTVELMRYLQLNFEFNKKSKVYINGTMIDEKAKNYKFSPENKLKFGDRVTIETEGNIKITDGDYKYLSITRERSEKNQLYIYAIEINEDNFKNKASDKATPGVTIVRDVTITLPNSNKFGRATYEVNSQVVKNKFTFKEGDKLKIKYSISNDSYVFNDRNVVEKLFKDKTKTVDIQISKGMDGTTIDLSKYFKVGKEK